MFAKQGLAVESIFFGAGPPAMQALIAGDLDIVVTSAPNVVNPRLGGADFVMIMSIIGKYTRLTDPEGLERTYKNYYASVLLDVPYTDPAGIKTLLDDMAPKNPKAAAADPKSFVDPSFVQEMEASGFIKQLYKR